MVFVSGQMVRVINPNGHRTHLRNAEGTVRGIVFFTDNVMSVDFGGGLVEEVIDIELIAIPAFYKFNPDSADLIRVFNPSVSNSLYKDKIGKVVSVFFSGDTEFVELCIEEKSRRTIVNFRPYELCPDTLFLISKPLPQTPQSGEIIKRWLTNDI